MARHTHATARIERNRMRNHSREGKWDVGYRDSDCRWHHTSRYSDEEEARESAERLSSPSKEEQSLIGLPADPDTEVRPADR